MRLFSLHPFNLAVIVEQLAPRQSPDSGRIKAHHKPDLLHRTRGDETELPDPGYWIAYDHFMVELEARARRREYIYRLIAEGWRALEQRVRDAFSARRALRRAN
jgi:hypothetical protein